MPAGILFSLEVRRLTFYVLLLTLEVIVLSINWYPGHMVKARKEIKENIKLIDVVIILLDARAPFSCRNMELERMASGKKIVMVLTKIDLAPPAVIRKYIKKLRVEGHMAAAIDSISGKGSKEVLEAISYAFKDKAEKLQKRGRRLRPIRVMVVGVPNVGKSTFLNCLVGRKMVKTGAKPGVTRGKQWIRVREDIEFMDTPGLMWPKIVEEEQGLKLALLDIIGENAYDYYDVALYLIRVLKEKSPQVLRDKFRLQCIDKEDEKILKNISEKRGYLLRGGEPDLDKTCRMLLQDFRRGSLGRMSLD